MESGAPATEEPARNGGLCACCGDHADDTARCRRCRFGVGEMLVRGRAQRALRGCGARRLNACQAGRRDVSHWLFPCGSRAAIADGVTREAAIADARQSLLRPQSFRGFSVGAVRPVQCRRGDIGNAMALRPRRPNDVDRRRAPRHRDHVAAARTLAAESVAARC